MAKATKSKKQAAGASNASFEAQLWAAADALRNNVDAAEYKHVVLGLNFLKYISDAFEAKHKELEAQKKQGRQPLRQRLFPRENPCIRARPDANAPPRSIPQI